MSHQKRRSLTMTLTSTTLSNKIFCLVGPSGTGKNEIANHLYLPEIISYRTREKRPGDIEGVNGYFISKKEFLRMEQEDLWIAKTNYVDNYYGITQAELFQLEESPMTYVVDLPGIETLKNALDKLEGYSSDQVVSIFIHTPREDLESRMLRRGKQSKEEIKARIDRADRDYASSKQCDYIVENHNGSLERTVYEVMKIIMQESFQASPKG